MALASGDAGTDATSSEPVSQPAEEEVLQIPTEPPKPLPTRGKPFTLAEWEAMFDRDGRFQGSDKTVKQAIFSGGIDPEARPAVWPFLFGVHTFQSTSR